MTEGPRLGRASVVVMCTAVCWLSDVVRCDQSSLAASIPHRETFRTAIHPTYSSTKG